MGTCYTHTTVQATVQSGYKVPICLDSGNPVSIVNESFAELVQPSKSLLTKLHVQGVGDTVMAATACIEFVICLGKQMLNMHAHILPGL